MATRWACVLAVLVSATARAEEPEPPVAAAGLAGIATAFVPFVVGAAILSQKDGLEHPRAGIYVIDAGLALAPLVGHGILGEWRRGWAFAAVSAGASLAAEVVLDLDPTLLEHGEVASRVPFGIFLSAALFSSAIGVADCFFARDRTTHVALRPVVAPGMAGLALGGSF